MRALILGGIRSGKSAHGESLLTTERGHSASDPSAHEAAAIRYLATGPTLSTDADWRARVDAHRVRRGDRYVTVETTELAQELRTHGSAPTLIDDLGNWLAARIDAVDGWSGDLDLTDDVDQLCSAMTQFTGPLVVISPEVGLSVVPPTPAGRLFTDQLGMLNAAVARVCDRVDLVVAGRVLSLPATASPSSTPAPTPTAPTRPSTAPPPEYRPEDGSSATPVPLAAEHVSGDAEVSPDVPDVSVSSDLPDGVDAEIFTPVGAPDAAVEGAARARQLTLTKPVGSLGRLEEIGNWVAACQSACPPRRFAAPRVVVFAGDHGVARDGVSAYPPEVTAQMVANIAAGGAAVNVLARSTGATVQVVDMSVDADTAPEVSRFKVRRSSGNLAVEDALSLAQARQALAAGKQIVDELVDGGADLLIAGEMGIGNTTPAAVLIGTLTATEPVVVVGRGTGVDDTAWMRKTAAIRDGMRRARKHVDDPLSMLAAVAGADLTAMAGFLAQAAVRRTPVILDGVVVTAAAMLAARLAPGASEWWLAGHRSTEPAHRIALNHLGLEPVLDLSMRLGEGSGALTALPIVTSAVDLLASMATFAEAGVSGG